MSPLPEIAMSTAQSANFSICVYCGSRPGADPRFAQSARDTGALIGSQGWELVYGGGKVGLMGMVADATLAAGGTVYGVIPQTLIDKEVDSRGLNCPLPILKAKRALADMQSGEVRLSPELVDYRMYAPEDIKCWPAGTGYALADWLRSRGHTPQFIEWAKRDESAAPRAET